MKFKIVILCPYIPDECNGDILTGSGVLKISEKIDTNLLIDFNHEKNELKNTKLINTEILNLSQEWGDKIAKKGSLIGTIESTNDQVNECIKKGRIKGVSLHTRFNPDESDVCACEIEEKPEDKTFNNTENKECLIPKYLSLIGGDKVPCNGFDIIIEEDIMVNEEDKKNKQDENSGNDVQKAEFSEEMKKELAEIFAESLKPVVEAISNLKVEKADDEDNKNSDKSEDKKNETTTTNVTEDSKDKLDIEKGKPEIKKDIFGLDVVKI